MSKSTSAARTVDTGKKKTESAKELMTIISPTHAKRVVADTLLVVAALLLLLTRGLDNQSLCTNDCRIQQYIVVVHVVVVSLVVIAIVVIVTTDAGCDFICSKRAG